MQCAFIGGGVMAEAMVSRALTRQLVAREACRVADPAEDRRDHLSGTYGVSVTADNAAAASGAAMVVLAVKPQQLPEVYAVLAGSLRADQTVLSVVAGARIARLAAGLGHGPVIRAMPNTPAQIGAGMSVWTASPAVGAAARSAAQGLLAGLGAERYVDDEGLLDVATAVSGSGPAYVFRFMEALTDAAEAIGAPREMAEELTLETVLGSARLAHATGTAPAVLRERVTSRGGTTAAGLAAMDGAGLAAAVAEAVRAAHRRARELGEEGG